MDLGGPTWPVPSQQPRCAYIAGWSTRWNARARPEPAEGCRFLVAIPWRTTRPAGPAVVEGLATYVDGRCGGYENGRILRTILDQGLLIPVETLLGDFRRQDDLMAYLQAASIIEFVVHRQGPEAVAVLWDQGLRASPALLQTSADVFLGEFEIWLTSTYDPVPSGAWESIRAGGCGIDVEPIKRAIL